MLDVVFKMYVPDRLLSVAVLLLMHFEGCRRAAKLRWGDGDYQNCETAVWRAAEWNNAFHAFKDGKDYNGVKNDRNMVWKIIWNNKEMNKKTIISSSLKPRTYQYN